MGATLDLLNQMGATANLPTATVAAVRQYDAAVEQVSRETRWTPQAKQEELTKHRAALAETFASQEAKHVADVSKRFDQDIGRIRAEMRDALTIGSDDSDAVRHARSAQLQRRQILATQAATDVAIVQASDDVTEIADLVREAIDREDPHVVDRVGRAAMNRLRRLSASKRKSTSDAAKQVYLGLNGELAEFRKAHPTPRERIAMLERQRETQMKLAGRPFQLARQAAKLETQRERDQRRVLEGALS